MNKNTSQKQILSDEEIIELYWQRNEKAIESTDVKYGRYLFTIAYNIVHNRMDSEECLNDTYLGIGITAKKDSLCRGKVMTTNRAGGLHKPPWGISHAEPIGSSNYPPLAVVAPPSQMWRSLKNCLPQWGKVARRKE